MSTRRPRPVGGRTQPLFARAAAEVARRRGAADDVSGLEETIVDLLQGRALDLYGEGLHQYVTLRLGDPGEASRVVDELRGVVAELPRAGLAEPPGMRARLYRLAREAAIRRAGAAHRPGPGRTLPWRQAREASDRAYTGAMRRLREGALPPADAELLELRHARELEVDEVAYVVDLPAPEVAARLDAAEGAARRVLEGALPATPAPRTGASAREDGLRDALVEAFALDVPSPSTPPPPPSASLDAPAPLEPGTVIGNRYALESHVGAGSFGDVYRARDTEVAGHVVALKLLHQEAVSDEARAEQLRELRLIASVFHPSVVQFKEFGWHERRLWFVMPWYEGETLEARLGRGPLDRREARRIFEPLARALATMHAAGIRHQDVKPDNIFLARIRGFAGTDDETLPVLLDLGVAATEAEMLLAGTPTYFAPEVAHLYAFLPQPPDVGPKADVFSLALSLRNALEPDTQDDVPAGALQAFVRRRATRGPSLPRARSLAFLRPHLERWLAVDPGRRPTADELAEELRVLTAPEERRARRRAVLRWLVPVGLGLLSVFLSVALWLGQRAQEKEREAAEASSRAERFEARYQDVKRRYQAKALGADGLMRELAGAEARGDALAQELGETQRSLDLSRQRRRSLTRDLYEANQRLADVRASLGETEARLAEARDEAAARARELSEARETLATRAEALAAAETGLAARGRELEALRAELTRREAAAEAARSEAAAADARAAAATRDHERWRSRANDAEARVARLEAALAEARSARPTRPATGAGGDGTGPVPAPGEPGPGD